MSEATILPTRDDFLKTGLVPVKFENLDIETTENPSGGDEDDGTDCALCRDSLSRGILVQTPCVSAKHIFHKDCLTFWLTLGNDGQANACPMCRHKLFVIPPSKREIMDEAFYISAHRPDTYFRIYHARLALWLAFDRAAMVLETDPRPDHPTRPTVTNTSTFSVALIAAANLIRARAEVLGHPWSRDTRKTWCRIVSNIWACLQTHGATERTTDVFVADLRRSCRRILRDPTSEFCSTNAHRGRAADDFDELVWYLTAFASAQYTSSEH